MLEKCVSILLLDYHCPAPFSPHLTPQPINKPEVRGGKTPKYPGPVLRDAVLEDALLLLAFVYCVDFV